MPPLSRRYLATAAGFLLIGVLLGFTLLMRRELHGRWPGPGPVTAHVHLILVGTVMELIIGIAWWFFPRPLRGDPPPSLVAATAAWWALTLSTAARTIGELVSSPGVTTIWSVVVVAGWGLQVAGLAAAVAALSRRVRPGRTPDPGRRAAR